MRILSFICLCFMMMGGLRAALQLPGDSGSYVEKKYAGWSGVLRGWVCSEWNCAGSFVSWLNRCAADFEKAHEGVYIEFETVSRQAMEAGDIHPPDMLIYSDGIVQADGALIALGGYVFAENPDASGTMIPEEHAAAYIAMEDEEEIEIEDSGIDLGLPAMAAAENVEISGDAFQRFMNGEAGRTIVNQAQLAKLIGLRENGRGPDWQCVPRGEYSWCDQRLYLGIRAEDERRELCAAFLEMLLEDDYQKLLSGIGAFAATGISIYDSFSPYHAMEQQLRASKRLFVKSEHSGFDYGGLVRKLRAGQISREEARGALFQTCS